ncbi:GmrSD restriction endonuclease domain-containing protein [Nitrospira sp. CMX1]
MKISTILDKIDEKQLFVPAFQREYVWKRDDAKMLVDSLIKEYPTGTMLTWETANPPELKGPHKYNEKQGAVRLLLDGQQRVTTLYMLIRGQIPPYYTQAEIMNDTRGLYVNLATLELSYYMKTRMDNDPYWQNVTDVFQGKVSAFDLQASFEMLKRTLGMEELKKLNDNINAVTRIKERDFPEQTIPVRANIREAIDIFYKVNASGVALTDAELALAQISGYWPKARDLFKAKLSQLEQEGFAFQLDFLMYVLLGCLHHLGSDMRKLHGEENKAALLDAWQRLDSQVLDYVVNLLRTSAFVDHVHEISSPYALVPIIVYCFDKRGKHLNDLETRKLVKWFYYSQIRVRYVSQLPQKLDRDLRILTESKQPFDDLLQVIAEERPLTVQPMEFVGRAIQHPLFSMVRWYLKSRGAVCLTTGVSLRKNMGKKYQLELDHIFPYSRLKKAGYDKGNRVKYALAQEFTNRALLTQTANRSKLAMEPSVYLADVKSRFPKALVLQCIPDESELWQLAKYEEFLEKRRELLASNINDFLNRITLTQEPEAPTTIEDLIREGESDELEFKSTLRWDLKSGETSKKMEEVIVKTVAALANGQGGTLVIGVDDDGNVIGLEHDYLSLGGATRDGFEVHLRNLLNEHLGVAFVASKVKIAFHEIGGCEVCQVDVEPASNPIVLVAKDKNGQKVERFYVRNGNASHEVPMSEMSAYVKERFH